MDLQEGELDSNTLVVVGLLFVLGGIVSLLSLRIRVGEKGRAMEDATYRVLGVVIPNLASRRSFHHALRRPLSYLVIIVGLLLVAVWLVR